MIVGLANGRSTATDPRHVLGAVVRREILRVATGTGRRVLPAVSVYRVISLVVVAVVRVQLSVHADVSSGSVALS